MADVGGNDSNIAFFVTDILKHEVGHKCFIFYIFQTIEAEEKFFFFQKVQPPTQVAVLL